jgi:hypothetical protein
VPGGDLGARAGKNPAKSAVEQIADAGGRLTALHGIGERRCATGPREIVDFENTFLLCYVRGPEGLIVELAERLDGAPG